MGILDKLKKKKIKKEPVQKEEVEKEKAVPVKEKKVSISNKEVKKIEKKSKESGERKQEAKKKSAFAYKHLVKPIISEKAMAIKDKFNKYVFEVSVSSNKVEIVKAIEELYNVKIQSINIINIKGRNVRYGRTKGKTKKRKKAIITLNKNEKIEMVEGV